MTKKVLMGCLTVLMAGALSGCLAKDMAVSTANFGCDSMGGFSSGNEKYACEKGVKFARAAVEPLEWYSTLQRAAAAFYLARNQCTAAFENNPSLQAACVTGVNFYRDSIMHNPDLK